MLCILLPEMKLTEAFFDELVLSPTVVHTDLIQISHILTVGENKIGNHNTHHKTRKHEGIN
jgi:hypothetical protein